MFLHGATAVAAAFHAEHAIFQFTVDQLAAVYGPMIQQLALRYMKSWEDAEEVAQDVMMKVVRRIDSSGTITSIAGKLDPEGSGALAQAHLADPRALVATPAGLVFAGGSSGTLQALRAAALETVAGRYPNANPTGMLARFRSKTFGAIGGLGLLLALV